MLGFIRKAFRRNDGTTIIEFAIVAPVMFLLLFGIIEFSLIMFISSILEGATSTAARLNKTGAERSMAEDSTTRASEDVERIREIILERGYNIIQPENLTVSIVPSGGSPANTVGGSGEMVTYLTTYSWQLQTPMIGQIISPDDHKLTLTSQIVVVNEPFEDDPVNNELDP